MGDFRLGLTMHAEDSDLHGTPGGPDRRDRRGVDRRRFLLGLGVVAGAGALAACGASGTSGGPSTARKPYSALTGPDMSGSAPGVRAQDDLFRHVNGGWYDRYQLPADKVSTGAMEELGDKVEQQLKEIIESIRDPKSGSEEAKIRDVYRAFMDVGAIDSAGIEPIRPMLAAIDSAADKTALFDVVGAQQRTDGGWGVVTLMIGPDSKNSSRNIVTVAPGGGGLEKVQYTDPNSQKVRDDYRAYLRKIAELAGLPDPEGAANRVFAFETRMAAALWDNEKYRDVDATYNVYQWPQLTDLAPGFDWARWRDLQGVKPEASKDLVVMQPSYLTAAAQAWAETDIATLKDCARIGIVGSYSLVLPQTFGDARFEFTKTLQGTEKQPDRWKTAVSMVDQMVGDALGKQYVKKHFSADAKRQVEKLVDNLKAAYRASLERSTWMTPPTRSAAIAKLDQITTKLGYPDKWEDYSALQTDGKSAAANLRAGRNFYTAQDLDSLTKPVDRSKWGMLPQTVNASYNPTNNEICFPAAILQVPFFSADNQAAVNYGAIGAIIGHEIGHAFDDQGSKYDGQGNVKDWWAPADRAEFDKRTQALIAQYSQLVPIGLSPENKVNGAMTVGENLSDLGGLSIAIDAFRIAVRNRDEGTEFADATSTAPSSGAPSGAPSPEPSLAPLFLSYARSWQGKTRPEAVKESLTSAVHSPPEFRTNQVVKNIDAFADTFGVKPGDGEWLDPKDRVKLW